MGAADGSHPEDGEGPVRPVRLGPYFLSATTVSNQHYRAFVMATGYRTAAEAAGGSLVFAGQLDDPEAHPVPDRALPWWRWVKGACWSMPDGATAARDDLPVVHLSLQDALEYCTWAGVRLPTEAEWECAATPAVDARPHIFSGSFPDQPDSFPGPVAVDAAPANANGVIHACGNVWEWTADRFTRLHSPREVRDPKGPLNGARFVVKGGSYLCCPSYCARFRPSSRRAELPGTTIGHTGFRVAANIE